MIEEVKASLHGLPEEPLHARHAEELDDVLREAAGDALGDAEALPLLEADVVVDVDDLAAPEVDQEVVEVAVAEADHVPDHRHDRDRAGDVLSELQPVPTLRAVKHIYAYESTG